MKKVLILTFSSAALALTLTPDGRSRSGGVLPTASAPLTRTASQTCGQCHAGSIGGPVVAVDPALRVIAPNGTTAITIGATGGASGTRGGLAVTVTDGQLIAGANTRINATGSGLAHSNAVTRSWTMNFRAPATPGVVRLHTVVNTVNGDGRTTGDQWAFHGSDPTNTTSTAVRLFVTAPGTAPIGESCADGFGNFSALGCVETPAVGNANFALEAVGLPPNARALLMAGLQRSMPSVDLTGLGAPGCFLHTDILFQWNLTTRPGNAQRAVGGLSFPLPIPNTPALKGEFFRAQVAVVDAQSRAALPVVFTNGIGVTIQ